MQASSDETRVISRDLDGAELRREKRVCSRYLVAEGEGSGCDDARVMQEARDHGGKRWSIPREAWERIFGHG